MFIVEYLIIVWAVVIEVTNLMRDTERDKHMTEPVPRFSSVIGLLLSLIGAIAYAVLAVVWVFSPDILVRASGITLVCLSGIGWSLDKSCGRPAWYPRFDAVLSLAALAAVVYTRLGGLA